MYYHMIEQNIICMKKKIKHLAMKTVKDHSRFHVLLAPPTVDSD